MGRLFRPYIFLLWNIHLIETILIETPEKLTVNEPESESDSCSLNTVELFNPIAHEVEVVQCEKAITCQCRHIQSFQSRTFSVLAWVYDWIYLVSIFPVLTWIKNYSTCSNTKWYIKFSQVSVILSTRGEGVHPLGRPPTPRWPLQRTVRILLECILVRCSSTIT